MFSDKWSSGVEEVGDSEVQQRGRVESGYRSRFRDGIEEVTTCWRIK